MCLCVLLPARSLNSLSSSPLHRSPKKTKKHLLLGRTVDALTRREKYFGEKDRTRENGKVEEQEERNPG